MKKKLIAAVALIALSATSLTGCVSDAFTSIEDIPLVPALSEKELVDYYKMAISYDTIATRTVKPHQVTYEMRKVTGDTKNKLVAEAKAMEGLLGRASIASNEAMSQNVQQYMKYVFDDKVLTNSKVKAVNEAMGYYFVDIAYKMTPRATGAFTDMLKYVGIHGALREDYKGDISVNPSYMTVASTSIQAYLKENPEYMQYRSPVAGIRQPMSDVGLYNKAAGVSLAQTAMMPPLSAVYSIPADVGAVAGHGIYPQGQFSLKEFGYNRDKMDGTATIRYVFKKDLMNVTKTSFTNAYCIGYKLDNKPKLDKDTIVPEFVTVEAEKILGRADRAIANNDLAALMSGRIYDDVGPGILNGNMRRTAYQQKHISKIKNVVGRNGHMYLFEFETLAQEGAKGVESLGTYVDSGYVVVQQVNSEFHITDYVVTERKMTKEPPINLDSTIMKRLAALNLTGEVTKEAKKGIKVLMSDMYKASTERKLQDIYACFNTDTSLLSSTHREYLNSQIRGWMTKHGANNKSVYMGAVTQWVGGADNQVEFFTEEVITYQGKDEVQYMQNYYLVSSYGGEWVIDEMKVVESKELTGAEAKHVVGSVKAGKSVSMGSDNNKSKKEAEAKHDKIAKDAQVKEQKDTEVKPDTVVEKDKTVDAEIKTDGDSEARTPGGAPGGTPGGADESWE